jgi:hypothetical protein
VKIAPSVCEGCGGGAERECSGCGRRAFIADSKEFWDDAEPSMASCLCGGEEFEAAVAFSLDGNGSVCWVTLGLRCRMDGVAGVYADWTIDYSPTGHLLGMA